MLLMNQSLLESIDLLKGLNEPQKKAVTSEDFYTLVLAGAGTGKTRVLTHRMAWLIQQKGVSPYAIMAVTFTNKAAQEMKDRVSALIQKDPRGLWVGTFHGLSNRILRTHTLEAGLRSGFLIMDSGDQLSLIKRLMKENRIDDQEIKAKEVQYFINQQKENAVRSAQLEDTGLEIHFEVYRALYEAYEKRCEAENIIDFSELLLRSYELLERNQGIRAHYQSCFKHLLVDEFQDTNTLQYQWLQLIAGDRGAIFAVGDDDQSIYAFRGARVENLFDFERRFVRGKAIRLEQNYRSTGVILETANAIIEKNVERLGKRLWSDNQTAYPIYVVGHQKDFDEGSYVVSRIQEFLLQGVAPQEIAVLYRSNAQSRLFEQLLMSQGIAYRVYGGMRFFERQEVKNALAYLRLLANPHDPYSFLRVVNFPPRGIGARSIEQLQEVIPGIAQDYFEAIEHVKMTSSGRLKAFREMILGVSDKGHELRVSELLDHVLSVSGTRLYYKNNKDAIDRLENMDELISAIDQFFLEQGLEQAKAFDKVSYEGNEVRAIDAFLSYVGLDSGEVSQSQDESVQLMSVHASKGLEFKVVFIVGLEEGLFPHEQNKNQEEERRLMYVAVTRAKERLFLSYAACRRLYKEESYQKPSSFLLDIPESVIKSVGLSPRNPFTPSQAQLRGRGFQRFANQNRPVLRSVYQTEQASQGYRIGQSVEHPTFGRGTIVGMMGKGEQTQVQVAFRNQGIKTLKLSMAKLTPLKG